MAPQRGQNAGSLLKARSPDILPCREISDTQLTKKFNFGACGAAINSAHQHVWRQADQSEPLATQLGQSESSLKLSYTCILMSTQSTATRRRKVSERGLVLASWG